MLVGTLGDEVLDLLLALFLSRVIELAGVGAELHAQLGIHWGHFGERLRLANSQALERRAGATLRHVARRSNCFFELTSKGVRQRCHQYGPSLTRSPGLGRA